jgi:hypothetical protein
MGGLAQVLRFSNAVGLVREVVPVAQRLLRSSDWIKVKNRKHPSHQSRQLVTALFRLAPRTQEAVSINDKFTIFRAAADNSL